MGRTADDRSAAPSFGCPRFLDQEISDREIRAFAEPLRPAQLQSRRRGSMLSRSMEKSSDRQGRPHRPYHRRRGRRRALAVILLIGIVAGTLLGGVLGYIISSLR
jgi:hypothetical protein